MKLFWIFLCLVFSQTLCHAFQDLTTSYSIRNYNDENGLPQNGVKHIISDSLGFVWLATEGGLARFDGQKFKVYAKSQIGFKSDRFVGFSNNTPDGKLYAIAEFGKTIRIKNGTALRDTLSSISYMDEVNLAPMSDAGIPIPSRQDIFFADEKIYRIIAASKSRYYVYYNQNVTLIESGKVKFHHPFKGEMSGQLPSLEWSHQRTGTLPEKAYNIHNFFPVDGQLFYHRSFLGCNFLAILAQKDSVYQTVTLQGEITKNPAFNLHKDNVRIFSNSVNNQSFAYLDSHLYLMSWVNGSLMTRLLLKGFDFDKNYIRTAYFKESDGCIFLGSLAKGLFVLTPRSFGTMTVAGDKSDNIFYAQAPFGPSSVITPNGFVLDPHKDAVEILEIPDDNLTTENAFLRDRKQNLWISRAHSLYKYRSDGKRVLAAWNIEEQPVRLYEDLKGGIWSGSGSGTIFYLNAQHNTSTVIQKVVNIAHSEITWFLQDRRERLWIGTENGLYELNTRSKLLSRTKGLEDMNIRCLYNSAPNQLWITTYGSGMFLLENGKLIKLPTDRGNYLDYAHCIIEDPAGIFWITTNKGLFQVPKKDLLEYAHQYLDEVFYLHHDKTDGFQTNEFNGGCQPCGIKIGAGLISFPSLSGFVWFDPVLVKNPLLSHPFILEEFNVDGKRRTPQDTITLPYDFSLFTLLATTPYFGTASNLYFKYNIQSSARAGKWTLSGKDHKISIFNLAPGEYTLTVKKMGASGSQIIERKIFITVLTPWFLHWGFLLLVLLLLTGLILLIVRWRTYYLIKRNLILGKKVANRTRELSTALDELKQSEAHLSRQLQVHSIINGAISHDIRSPLKYLSSNIKKLRQQVESEFPTFPYLHIGKLIHESTDQVLAMTEDLLRFIKIIKDDKEIVVEPISARQMLDAKADLFTEIAKENGTTITVIAEDHVIVHSNRQMLDIIIHNLLDNAVKSTFQDSIIMAAQNVDGQIKISVSDTGGGIPQDIADWFNFPSKKDTGITGHSLAGSGFGLVVVKEIAAMLEIDIKVITTEIGTTVELILN